MALATSAPRPETVTHPAPATTWRIDPDHSRAGFAVRKRLFFVRQLTVIGRASGIAGALTLDKDRPDRSSVAATIAVATIDTGNARRDKQLHAPAWFDAEQSPTIAFQSRAVEPVDAAAGHYRITGDLTVRGITRSVDLDTRIDPAQTPEAGRLHFTATTTLNRRDFGLDWDSPFIKVFDEVVVTLEIAAVPSEQRALAAVPDGR